MARLLLCIALAFLLALGLRMRPIVAMTVAIVGWVALPAVAAQILTGQATGPLAMHPSTWLVVAAFIVQLVFRPGPIAAAVARFPLLVTFGAIFVAGCLWTSLVNDSGGLRLLLDQILAPMLLFVLVVAFARGDQRDFMILRNTILALAAVQSVLTMVQLRLGRIILFEAYYETQPWFNPLKFDRWMGTTDSPLILAYLLCIAAALALGVRHVGLRFSLLGLYLVSVLITQSRLGVGVICAVVVYAVLRSRMPIWARGTAAAAALGAGYILTTSTLIAGFASRLANDTGSADARQRALVFIFENWAGYLFAGEGLTASYAVARGAGLETSIESSILMYAVDVGWALTLVYFGSQATLILSHGFRLHVVGTSMAAVIALVLPQFSSALAWSNVSGTLLWTTLALLVLAGTPRGQPGQTSGAPAAASLAMSSGSYRPAT